MDIFNEYILTAAKYTLVVLSVVILARCISSMFSQRYEGEIWAYVRNRNKTIPVTHWENIIGRSRSSDIYIDSPKLSKVHAVLKRSDKGVWTIYDIFSKGGVWVNGIKVNENGVIIHSGDVINLAGNILHFIEIKSSQHETLEKKRLRPGITISPAITLVILTAFQLCLMTELAINSKGQYTGEICLSFLALILVQWICYNLLKLMDRTGFEVEILALYLSSLGMYVAASSTPEDMYKQLLLTIGAIALFWLTGWWLRNLKRTLATRIPMAVLAVLLLGLNVVTSDAVFGARNWLEIGGYSFQPSEFVKVAYIYMGASTLDKLYRTKNLYGFIGFSALCVVALALIGDFGTALIFFICFLVISYMRSGSLATILLSVTGAGLAGFLAVSVKPYIAQRFAVWGHVWEDIYDKGYQQTRAMSAAASGGLFGKGAGAGWLKNIFAANTDMVFAMTCEELGVLIGICMMLAILVLAFFAIRSARSCRSAYYSIGACAAISILLVQVALNVFGSLDILPFTGVTFPFVSRGGSSLLSCWMLMAFIKGADTRKSASFAVRNAKDSEFEADEAEEEELKPVRMGEGEK